MRAPPGNYNGIYTGIYLPTFREGTHFIIKTVSFVSGGPYGPRGVLSDFEGGVPKVYNRTDPKFNDRTLKEQSN